VPDFLPEIARLPEYGVSKDKSPPKTIFLANVLLFLLAVGSGSSLCTRLVLLLVWVFLLVMLVAVSIVTFALWDRSMFESSASKLGLRGGAVAQYVLDKITGLTSK